MDTAQLAIITSAVLGLAGISVPAATARGNRKHEREMARRARLHDQRRHVYTKVALYCETERVRMWELTNEWTVAGRVDFYPDKNVRNELQAEIAVAGSREVQDALSEVYDAVFPVVGAVVSRSVLRKGGGREMQLEKAEEK
jgi:hypothetical protein